MFLRLEFNLTGQYWVRPLMQGKSGLTPVSEKWNGLSLDSAIARRAAQKNAGVEFDGLDRSIDHCISTLRRKCDDAASEKIKPVWGLGYLFSPSAWGAPAA